MCFFLDNLEGTTNSFIDKQIFNQIVFQETMRKCEHNNITKKKEKKNNLVCTQVHQKKKKRKDHLCISLACCIINIILRVIEHMCKYKHNYINIHVKD